MSKLASSCFGGAAHAAAAQPGVDGAGRLLAVPDCGGDRPIERHHVAAGEHAGASGLHVGSDDDGAVLPEFDAGHGPQERGVGVLAKREDERVGLERLDCAGRLREALSSSFITSTVIVVPSICLIVRSQ